MVDNQKTLQNGFADGLRMIQDTLVKSLIASIHQLFNELPWKKGYSGFTGQTQTSYMAGVYVGGSLRYIINQQVWKLRPRRGKVRYQEIAFLKRPYEGQERAVIGSVLTEEPSGQATSLRFLQGYQASHQGLTVVITTGTEYSEYLEGYGRLDVLTRTFQDAGKVMNGHWMKIPE